MSVVRNCAQMESNTTRFSSTSLEDSATFGKVGQDFFLFSPFPILVISSFALGGKGGPLSTTMKLACLQVLLQGFCTQNRTSLAGSQCPRTDLNKRFLPRPNTTTA